MVRKIVTAEEKTLREPSQPIGNIDKKIKDLAQDLIDTLVIQKDPEGIGLAGPQIGKNLKIFAMRDGKDLRVIINPKILKVVKKPKDSKKPAILEGCLSIPHYYGPVDRALKITIEYQTLDGITKVESFTGLPAQIVQHEIDHLNGVLFVDHILSQKKKLYLHDSKNDDWEEVEI